MSVPVTLPGTQRVTSARERSLEISKLMLSLLSSVLQTPMVRSSSDVMVEQGSITGLHHTASSVSLPLVLEPDQLAFMPTRKPAGALSV